VSLSGGQKARQVAFDTLYRLGTHMHYRVALARAVYARTKYVLLDDPLSAVV
jgi:ABC-type nitrate/sulfonate/bicarbonate transport system ATPase subunit